MSEFQGQILFEEETNILKAINENILDSNLSEFERLDALKKIAQEYAKLLKYTKKIVKISDIQGKHLKTTENELRKILDNINQGFLTFDKNYVIGRNYSAQCDKIFNKKIGNINVLELFAEQSIEMNYLFKNTFENVFNAIDKDETEKYFAALPEMIIMDHKYINIMYNTLFIENEFLIMLILSDVTKKIQIEKEVEHLIIHDKLTGLYNRTFIENNVSFLQSQELFPLGLIFGDMNGLKLTNDVFGHQKGDELIISMADILKQCCWNDEYIIRWAGDEFVIIVHNASLEVCNMISERIKKVCAKTKWSPIGPSIAMGVSLQENIETDIDELLRIAEKNMYICKTHESVNVKKQIVFAMQKVLHSKCYETYEHIKNVEDLSIELGMAAGVLNVPSEIEEMKLLSKLHDVGKTTISSEILRKPGKLTEFEWEIIKSHSEIGFRMAQAINEPGVARGILYSHERWDGTGYPQGLKGEQIPILSRIVAIAEAYDVMMHGRPYREAINKEQALEEINRKSGTYFDPNLVCLFSEICRREEYAYHCDNKNNISI